MSASSSWHESNDQYLAQAVAWVRLRLAAAVRTPAEGPIDAPEPSRSFLRRILDWFLGLFGDPSPAPSSHRGTPTPSAPRPGRGKLLEAFRKMAAAEELDPPPALLQLTERFGLTEFEKHVLLFCVAMELDTRVGRLCAEAQGDSGLAYPTFGLAFTLFSDPAWDAMSPDRPLRFWRLVELVAPGGSLTTRALRVDERILHFVKGMNTLDERLASFLVPIEIGDSADDLPASQRRAAQQVSAHLLGSAQGRGATPPAVQLLGADGPCKRSIAVRVAREAELNLYRLPAGLLPDDHAELDRLVRLAQREAVLAPTAFLIDASDDTERAVQDPASPLRRFLAHAPARILIDTREVLSGLERPAPPVEVGLPEPGEQREAWRVALGDRAGDSPELLAGQFHLGWSDIREIAHAAQELGDEEGPLHDRLWRTCLMRTRPRLDLLAQRIDAKAAWDDLVLPVEEKELLRRMAQQTAQRTRVYDDWGFRARMNRGLGITGLFAGESGTGKTMAAEVIANDLHLSLYRVDLSSVVSKYIGETEKNLRRLFDAAEQGGAALLFDEADALFGKRSEVRDSHDRYANIEVNYLLQRMESYRGIAILTTNRKSALDSAFVRRLRFIIDFPFPGTAERRDIWKGAFPERVASQGLDWDRLARLNLSGGSIQNVALQAAFLAAHADTHVTMPIVLESARMEYRKLSRPISEADFRWTAPAGVAT